MTDNQNNEELNQELENQEEQLPLEPVIDSPEPKQSEEVEDSKKNKSKKTKKNNSNSLLKEIRRKKFLNPFYLASFILIIIISIIFLIQMNSDSKLTINGKILYTNPTFVLNYNAEKILYEGEAEIDDIVYANFSGGIVSSISLNKNNKGYPAKVIDKKDGFLHLKFDFPKSISRQNFDLAYNSEKNNISYLSDVKITLKYVGNKFKVIKISPLT